MHVAYINSNIEHVAPLELIKGFHHATIPNTAT